MRISQAFILSFCVLQVIKDWRWERPGNKANTLLTSLATQSEGPDYFALSGLLDTEVIVAHYQVYR